MISMGAVFVGIGIYFAFQWQTIGPNMLPVLMGSLFVIGGVVMLRQWPGLPPEVPVEPDVRQA